MRITVVLLASLIAGGYFWHKDDLAATARAQFLADPIVEDTDTSVGLSPAGFLNRDVRVSAYTFAERNRAVEDHWIEEIAHGNSSAEFYKRGFRKVVISDSNISRTIIAPRSTTPKEAGESSALETAPVHYKITCAFVSF